MRIENVGTEARVADLLDRLYDLRRASEATKREVREALFAANPHLDHDLRRVPEGTVVLVPDVPGVSAAADPGRTPGPADLLWAVRAAVEQAGGEMDASATLQAEEAKQVLAVAKSRELKAVVARSPDLQERLPAIVEAAKVRAEEAEAARQVQTDALAVLRKDLEDFLGQLS